MLRLMTIFFIFSSISTFANHWSIDCNSHEIKATNDKIKFGLKWYDDGETAWKTLQFSHLAHDGQARVYKDEYEILEVEIVNESFPLDMIPIGKTIFAYVRFNQERDSKMIVCSTVPTLFRDQDLNPENI